MEELHTLIRSLNKHEKKFVRRFTTLSRNGGDNVLPNFYDIIEKNEVFDEQKIKNSFKKKYPTTNIFVYRTRLYDLTLSALKATNAAWTYELELLNKFIAIRLLLAKGLYKKAKYDLNDLITEAEAIENFNLVLLLVGVQQNLLRGRIYTLEEGYTTKGLKEKEDALFEEAKKQSDLRYLFLRQVDIFYNRHPQNREHNITKMDIIMSSPLLEPKNEPRSALSKELYFEIHFRNFIYRHEIEKALPLIDKVIVIYKDALFPIEFERKISVYYYQIICSVYLNKPKRCLQSLNLLFELKPSGKLQEVLLFSVQHITGVYYHYLVGNKEDAFSLIDKAKDEYLKLHEYIPFEYKTIIIEMAASINISRNQFKETIWWLNHLVNDHRYEKQFDLQCWCKFMYMLCHVELKNIELLESHYRSFSRLMKKLNYWGPLERLMFDLFKEVISHNNNPKKKINYEKYRKNFLDLKTSINVEYFLSIKIFADYLQKKNKSR